jgi:hypothetical protein
LRIWRVPVFENVVTVGQAVEQRGRHLGVAKPSLGVDVVQASGLDERVYDSGTVAAFIRAGEQVVLAPDRQRPDRPARRRTHKDT